MSSSRSRGRGSKSLWHWILRSHIIRRLLAVLSIAAFVAIQLHFYNSTTRRYKDCSVPWPTVDAAAAAAARGAGGDWGLFADGGVWGGGHRYRHHGAHRSHKAGPHMRIVLVSMSTGRSQDSAEAARQQAAVNARSAEFEGLLDITGPNKRQYAEQHGYSYVDASDLLDNSRPASWSKIPAVLSVLDQYDWIFWLDADTLITNLTLPVEALLPPPELAGSGAAGAPDLLLTADSTGVNAGVWLIRGRGCGWCRSFLALWWSQEVFIRRGAHDTKSGDNDALKYLVAHMDSVERETHVGLAPQCAFNSYLWRPSVRNCLRYLVNPRHILTGLWQRGDFVMHAAGVHNKMAVLRRFLATAGLASTPGPATGQPPKPGHDKDNHRPNDKNDNNDLTAATPAQQQQEQPPQPQQQPPTQQLPPRLRPDRAEHAVAEGSGTPARVRPSGGSDLASDSRGPPLGIERVAPPGGLGLKAPGLRGEGRELLRSEPAGDGKGGQPEEHGSEKGIADVETTKTATVTETTTTTATTAPSTSTIPDVAGGGAVHAGVPGGNGSGGDGIAGGGEEVGGKEGTAGQKRGTWWGWVRGWAGWHREGTGSPGPQGGGVVTPPAAKPPWKHRRHVWASMAGAVRRRLRAATEQGATGDGGGQGAQQVASLHHKRRRVGRRHGRIH